MDTFSFNLQEFVDRSRNQLRLNLILTAAICIWIQANNTKRLDLGFITNLLHFLNIIFLLFVKVIIPHSHEKFCVNLSNTI